MSADIIDEKSFNDYDERHYSLENKLIKLNKTYIEKIKLKEEWQNDYKVRELVQGYDSSVD